MNYFIISFLLLFAPAFGEFPAGKSNTFKKLTRYLPTLTEIGFISGSVNIYIQASTLVRVLNHEIAQAKNFVNRLDQLERQSKSMWSDLKELKNISPYDMDTWADWLDNAENLATWETRRFTSLLFDGIVMDIDTRLTRDFWDDVKNVRELDINEGAPNDVLRYYYYHADYAKYKKSAIKDEKFRIGMRLHHSGLRMEKLKERISKAKTKAELKALEKEEEILIAERKVLKKALSTVGERHPLDRKIGFLAKANTDLFSEIDLYYKKIGGHQKSLEGLYKEWESLAGNKISKQKDLDYKIPIQSLSGEKYLDSSDKYQDEGESNTDDARVPKNTMDKPENLDVSSTRQVVSLSDIQHLKNRIEYEKLQIMQTALQAELSLTNTKAILLAQKASNEVAKINQQKATIFSNEVMKADIKRK